MQVKEHLLKSAEMKNAEEGSYDRLEHELLEYVSLVTQQEKKPTIANVTENNDKENDETDEKYSDTIVATADGVCTFGLNCNGQHGHGNQEQTKK